MSKWEERKLGEIAPFKYGKSLVAEKRIAGQYDVFSSGGICGKSDNIIAETGIIIGRKGSIGTIYYSSKPFYCIDTAFYIDSLSDKSELKFLYYYIQVLGLDKFNTDAAVPGLKRSLAENLKIRIPDLPTQKRIAGILSAYDDLIENNNRRIELLEKAAQDLYKEWFVRFRFPGHETAKFQNGLPEGWEVKRLGEISDFTYGKMPSKDKISETGYPIFSGYRINGFYNEYLYENQMLVLIARGVGGTGEIRLSPPKAFITNLSIIFKLFKECIKLYLFQMFSLQNLRYLDTGAAQSQITIENLKNIKITIPNTGTLEKYNSLVNNIFLEKTKLDESSQNLKKQRDLLLPRLMSGKLEV